VALQAAKSEGIKLPLIVVRLRYWRGKAMKSSVNLILSGLGCSLMLSSEAIAAPGVGGTACGATMEAGEIQVEACYGHLDGCSKDGDDAIVLEVAHSY
jgi:hypothetical protein